MVFISILKTDAKIIHKFHFALAKIITQVFFWICKYKYFTSLSVYRRNGHWKELKLIELINLERKLQNLCFIHSVFVYFFLSAGNFCPFSESKYIIPYLYFLYFTL